jgi:hypothetical protein
VEGNLDVECAEHEARRGGEAAWKGEVVMSESQIVRGRMGMLGREVSNACVYTHAMRRPHYIRSRRS